jgi:hypothetical protein
MKDPRGPALERQNWREVPVVDDDGVEQLVELPDHRADNTADLGSGHNTRRPTTNQALPNIADPSLRETPGRSPTRSRQLDELRHVATCRVVLKTPDKQKSHIEARPEPVEKHGLTDIAPAQTAIRRLVGDPKDPLTCAGSHTVPSA